MTQLHIDRGDIVTIENTRYEVMNRAANRDLCVRCPANGNVRQISEEEFFALYLAGSAVLGEPDPASGNPDDWDPLECDFASQPAKHKNNAYRKKAFLDAIIAAGVPAAMSQSWPPIIAAVAASTGLKKYSWIQLYRDIGLYRQSGHDIRALLPAFKLRGRRVKFVSDEHEEFHNLMLAKYFRKERPTATHSYGQFVNDFNLARAEIPGAQSWPIPDESTYRRRLKAVDPYAADVLRLGKDIAEHKYKAVEPGKEAHYALEVVEIDSTVANINIIDDHLGVYLGRPTITIAMDRFTRMPVGVYIGLEPPSTFTLMQCLHNMILPKNYMDSEFPELRMLGVKWIAAGIPTRVMLDNAAENHSESLRDVAAVAGFGVTYQPRNYPQAKGMIERFMRTIEQSGLTWMPGRTFSNPVVRGKYDPVKHACIRLRDFRMLFHFWMIVKYARRFSQKRLAVPELTWKQELERKTPRLPKKKTDLDALLGLTLTGTVSRQGIIRFGLRFQSPELNALLRIPNWNNKAIFKVNEHDLGAITVIHPVSGQYFRVPCTAPKYANGLSKFQHQRIRAFRRAQGMKYEHEATLPEAKAALYALSEKILLEGTKAKDTRKLARFLSGSRTRQPATDPDYAPVEPSIELIREEIEVDFKDSVKAPRNKRRESRTDGGEPAVLSSQRRSSLDEEWSLVKEIESGNPFAGDANDFESGDSDESDQDYVVDADTDAEPYDRGNTNVEGDGR